MKHALTFAFWSENLNDLYLLDPASPSSLGWVNLDENTKGAAPSPRNGHGFVALGSLLYVFGGMVGPQLQCKNGVIITNCRKIVEQVIFFPLSFCSDSECVASFSAAASNELYVLDPQQLSWTNLTDQMQGPIPSPRGYHGFTADGNKLYVFGGDKIGFGTFFGPISS